jgi:osmotically inducible protein OsmC
MKRKVNAIWIGDGADGNGVLSAQSGAFEKMPYSFKTRFENDEGKLGTNPEELIAAAHAGCFNMKLSFVLNEAGYSPEELNTDAVLTFEDGKIISIELNLRANVTGVSKEKFMELAEDAKNNCPISGALNCDIVLNPTLI